MSTNLITISIPQEVIDQTLAALNQAKKLLQPYLQSLTNEERRRLPKMGDDSFSFVSKVNDYCGTNPEFCPSYLNTAELATDFTVVNELNPLHDVCQQLFTNIDDTMLLAGSEAYTASLMYYGSVQGAAKTGQPNARSIFEDLKQRFLRKPKQKTP